MASSHSRGVSPRLMPRSNRSTSGGDFGKHRIERLVEELEPGDLGVVQIDDHAGALGGIDARLAQRVLETLVSAPRAWLDRAVTLRSHTSD